MTPPRLTVREPRELLSYIPFRLGFRPADSAVLVGLRGARGVVGLVVRVDLSDLADVAHGPQVARGLVAHVAGEGATRAVLVLYGASEGAAGSRLRAAAEHTAEAADLLLGEVPVWVVGPTGYRALDCDDEQCCGSAAGRPLADLESTVVGATMVAQGVNPRDCRADVERIAPAPPERLTQAARAASRWEARARDLRATPARWRSLAQLRAQALDAWLDAVRGLAAGQRPPVTTLGRLGAALGDALVRDAVLVACIEPEGRLARQTLHPAESDQDGAAMAALDRVLHPTRGRRPDDGVGTREELLRMVLAHARPHRQAPAVTLLAALAWWQGDGARANVLVARALQEDPAHRLAVLLDRALGAGLPPGWARGADVVGANLR